jgi:hypothetical protein
MHKSPSLGTKINRIGHILREITSARISDYDDRFSQVAQWYDSFFNNIIIDQYIDMAIDTTKRLFNKYMPNFVAIDETEYSKQFFDMVAFFALLLRRFHLQKRSDQGR